MIATTMPATENIRNYWWVFLLLIIWGLALMALGLWIFYALLPLWYGLFGGLLGYAIGAWLTGGPGGWVSGLFVWTIAIVVALLFAGLAYQLEPFRRILAGLLMGFGLGSLLATLFGGGVFRACPQSEWAASKPAI